MLRCEYFFKDESTSNYAEKKNPFFVATPTKYNYAKRLCIFENQKRQIPSNQPSHYPVACKPKPSHRYEICGNCKSISEYNHSRLQSTMMHHPSRPQSRSPESFPQLQTSQKLQQLFNQADIRNSSEHSPKAEAPLPHYIDPHS